MSARDRQRLCEIAGIDDFGGTRIALLQKGLRCQTAAEDGRDDAHAEEANRAERRVLHACGRPATARQPQSATAGSTG